jgi:hypothetical protein
MAERNPLDLYRKHFGFVGLPYPGTRAEQARVDILASADVEKRDAATIARQSTAPAHYLGTPIFMPVNLGGYQLPFEPLVEIAGGKSIVRTPLTGWNGTVKENMGLDDYAITIRGIVLNEDGDDYPEAEVLQLRNLFERKESLDIICPLLGLFNISRMAIENLRLPAEEGTLHYQPYELTGYSDFDVELLLRDDLQPLTSRNVSLQR